MACSGTWSDRSRWSTSCAGALPPAGLCHSAWPRWYASKREFGDFVLKLEWRIKEAPYVNKNVFYVLPDGSHARGVDGKELKLALPDSDSGVYMRDPKGKIKLIVSYSRWWGWGGRPVAVPIEVVAILGRQIAALDMPPAEFATAPTWTAGNDRPIPPDEMIRIAITRR